LPTCRKHVGIGPKRHDIDTASEEPKWPYVADMVCVVSAIILVNEHKIDKILRWVKVRAEVEVVIDVKK
jgi:hypothetical protein